MSDLTPDILTPEDAEYCREPDARSNFFANNGVSVRHRAQPSKSTRWQSIGGATMALRGVKPTAVDKRLKALLYGYAGVGKTTAAIQFPQPYLIDTEKGAENDQYVKLLNDRGGAIFQTSDFDEMVREVTSLLTEQHDYRTLVIDPITVVYDDLLSKAEKTVGSEFGRHFGEANKQMKHLLNLLVRLDMNVIITAHAKKEYGDNLKVIGETFDGYKKLDYLFDLVFFIQKQGQARKAYVRKSRVEAFKEGESFPFSYDEVAERYGREIIERTATPETLATPEQVDEIKRLIELLKTPTATVEKWLDKARAARLDELPADAAGKVVEFLQGQIQGKAVA